MQDGDSEEEVDLKALARRLRAKGLPTQAEIASLAEVSQPTVSRATRGLISTASPGAKKLWGYVNSRAAVIAVTQAAKRTRLKKKSPAAAARRGQSPRRPRALRLILQATDDIGSIADLPREELAKIAEEGLREYLEDAFDPLLVIEQLSVLRRAQDTRRVASHDQPAPSSPPQEI
jgi:transcriptional regulator with XRE-family HTH domain